MHVCVCSVYLLPSSSLLLSISVAVCACVTQPCSAVVCHPIHASVCLASVSESVCVCMLYFECVSVCLCPTVHMFLISPSSPLVLMHACVCGLFMFVAVDGV